jgi:hypothetical protein
MYQIKRKLFHLVILATLAVLPFVGTEVSAALQSPTTTPAVTNSDDSQLAWRGGYGGRGFYGRGYGGYRGFGGGYRGYGGYYGGGYGNYYSYPYYSYSYPYYSSYPYGGGYYNNYYPYYYSSPGLYLRFGW